MSMTPADAIEKFIGELYEAPKVKAAMRKDPIWRDHMRNFAAALHKLVDAAQTDPDMRPYLTRIVEIAAEDMPLKGRLNAVKEEMRALKGELDLFEQRLQGLPISFSVH